MESCKLPDVPLFRGLTETEAAAAIEALRMRRRPFAKGKVLLEACSSVSGFKSPVVRMVSITPAAVTFSSR